MKECESLRGVVVRGENRGVKGKYYIGYYEGEGREFLYKLCFGER